MTDDHAFLQDSLFCAWAYVANLDTRLLEVYRGLNKDRAAQAPRYALTASPSGYWACRLLATFPLDALPSDAAFLARCHAQDP
jgi:hypothetical protein